MVVPGGDGGDSGNTMVMGVVVVPGGNGGDSGDTVVCGNGNCGNQNCGSARWWWRR